MVVASKPSRSATPRKGSILEQVTKQPGKIPKPSKPNASILSFFQKTEKPEDSLFVGRGVPVPEPPTDPNEEDIYGCDRYNEIVSPIKKRKIEDGVESQNGLYSAVGETASHSDQELVTKRKVNAPFVLDSDSESDSDDEEDVDNETKQSLPNKHSQSSSISKDTSTVLPVMPSRLKEGKDSVSVEMAAADVLPPLLLGETSADNNSDVEEFHNIDETEDMDLDNFEGEEMRERRFMQEQARLEAEEAGDISFLQEQFGDGLDDDECMEPSCPICSGSLSGISPDEATRHVNSCLDGNPTPLLPTATETTSTINHPPAREVQVTELAKRFQKAAVPRPAQPNPFNINGTEKATKSAFSQLMSGNAEDSAWATAAAAENASRGRPAYMRTCPFYKIMPGFSICVDAFRYGAVAGCKAYFLSHFHSDHYIGLTANWTHGPIYCSKVTGSLVKKQLRTAAKWVVELEFEKPVEIDGTGGARVTMIPANHCPGSSIFIFEKPFTTGNLTRTKRILHCGDFRACPEHVQHQMLRPDIPDTITGKLRQQKIDICYLDTTYLNPRYSFPPQDDVIRASADLCASLSPDPNCSNDIWGQAKTPTGMSAVSKYFQSAKMEQQDGKAAPPNEPGQRLLVICGTYSIGKERICVAIAKALGSKIYATPNKIKICQQLDDPELTALLTSNPVEAQVHMQMLMEIRAETLQDYLTGYKPHFSRIVGLRPSGWNYRPANGKALGANVPPSTIPTQQILHSKGWRTRFTVQDFVPQRGSTKEAMCFGVPYSEHSSFRELAMFLMCLRIEKVIPTVNVGSEQSRKRMKGWIDRWLSERRKGGLVEAMIEGSDEDGGNLAMWDGKSGKGGKAWW